MTRHPRGWADPMRAIWHGVIHFRQLTVKIESIFLLKPLMNASAWRWHNFLDHRFNFDLLTGLFAQQSVKLPIIDYIFTWVPTGTTTINYKTEIIKPKTIRIVPYSYIFHRNIPFSFRRFRRRIHCFHVIKRRIDIGFRRRQVKRGIRSIPNNSFKVAVFHEEKNLSLDSSIERNNVTRYVVNLTNFRQSQHYDPNIVIQKNAHED